MVFTRSTFLPLLLLCGLLLALPATVRAQPGANDEPAGYRTAELHDRVTRLQCELEAGRVQLDRDAKWGYLPALLRALDVPVASQSLVFSKTSLQFRRISPTNPRAIYFNDEVYVGYLPGSDTIELSAADPELGGVFFTLSQNASEPPRIRRQIHDCLACHASAMTGNVPGHMIRSVYPDHQGQPILRAGTYVTTDASPFEERWGGWYVTGTHGEQRHMGNVTLDSGADRDDLNRDAGANIVDLSAKFNTSAYLTPHSDLVALLVLEHQTQMHNALAHANMHARRALRDEAILLEALGRSSEEEHLESTLRRVAYAGEPVVKRLLLAGEAPLRGPVAGTSSFAADFAAAAGPRDAMGRSLRQLDLNVRLFRYPCSYLIYTEAFDALPELVHDYVYRRLDEVLSGRDTSETFRHLSPADRQAVRAILLATKPDFANYVARDAAR